MNSAVKSFCFVTDFFCFSFFFASQAFKILSVYAELNFQFTNILSLYKNIFASLWKYDLPRFIGSVSLAKLRSDYYKGCKILSVWSMKWQNIPKSNMWWPDLSKSNIRWEIYLLTPKVGNFPEIKLVLVQDKREDKTFTSQKWKILEENKHIIRKRASKQNPETVFDGLRLIFYLRTWTTWKQ